MSGSLTILGNRVRRASKRCCDPLLNAQYYLYRDWLRNPRSRRLCELQRPALNACQRRVVDDLMRGGIAFAHVDELVGDRELQRELGAMVDAFVKSDSVRNLVQRRRTASNMPVAKEYLVRLFPKEATISGGHPLLRFGIHSRMLDAVNSYLQLWSRLNYTDVWYTMELNPAHPRVGSQRWHRDPEDETMVKVFLYFSDVDEGAGPLEYIPGSCIRGPHGDLWRKKGNRGQLYVEQGQVEERFPASNRALATGPAGTIVFCDTSGLHRGGHATTKSRIFATWCYVTPASLWRRRFRVQWPESGPPLWEAARFALA
jgi:Phytanoyl-CoA dioxygenase (PhyH)